MCVTVKAKEQQGQNDNIVNIERNACEIPSEALHGVRCYHQALQENKQWMRVVLINRWYIIQCHGGTAMTVHLSWQHSIGLLVPNLMSLKMAIIELATHLVKVAFAASVCWKSTLWQGG